MATASQSEQREPPKAMAHSTGPVLTPTFRWAQRPNALLLTIPLSDVHDAKIDFTSDHVDFSGVSHGKNYALHLDLAAKVDVGKSSFSVKPRAVEITLVKEDAKAPYWKHVLKDPKGYVGRFTIDWERWQPENADDDADGIGAFDEN
jgi:hypothetical protein